MKGAVLFSGLVLMSGFFTADLAWPLIRPDMAKLEANLIFGSSGFRRLSWQKRRG